MTRHSHRLASIVIAMLGFSSVGPAGASPGGLADGEYDCGGGYTYRSMGKVDIRGDQFRYRPFDDVMNGFAPYSADAGGRIQWNGPFGGLDDPPARIVGSTREQFGFNVTYQGSADGLVQTMSCHAPGR